MDEILYKQKVGLRKGRNALFCMKSDWPFSTIEIHDDKIILRYCFFCKLELQRSEIDDFEHGRGVLSNMIRINHHKTGASPYIELWSFRKQELFDNLRQYGYKVKETKEEDKDKEQKEQSS